MSASVQSPPQPSPPLPSHPPPPTPHPSLPNPPSSHPYVRPMKSSAWIWSLTTDASSMDGLSFIIISLSLKGECWVRVGVSMEGLSLSSSRGRGGVWG